MPLPCRASFLAGLTGLTIFAIAPAVALAQQPAPPATAPTSTAERGLETVIPANAPAPPPVRSNYLNIGVAFTGEFAPSGGHYCGDDPQLCILGSGGGIVVRGGWRLGDRWYAGAAYEISKQDPSKLYRLATLQQARFEGRRYFNTGRETVPYAAAGGGLAGYGNEGGVATWGPTVFLGIGAEWQIPNGPLIGVAAMFRSIYFVEDVSAGGATWTPGIAHLFALEVAIEGTEKL